MQAGPKFLPGPEFVPGTVLADRYYADVVRPLLDSAAPGLAHSAGLLGWGSDVLGFDSPRSTDHNWGPRCQVFVAPGEAGRVASLGATIEARLPAEFLGWPTAFPDATAADATPRHWVQTYELGGWLADQLGFEPRSGVSLLDWLATPTQRLAELTSGAVFHDELGLQAARQALAWYPDDIWRYVLACQWRRISQEEAFGGRCAEAGDDLGSALIMARLARDLVRLVLLMHRQYPPYSKWLGSAFARLPGTADLREQLAAALAATSWTARERALCAACELVGGLHNDLRLTDPVEVTVRGFYDRPYLVLDAGRFEAALRATITDPTIAKLAPVGAIDQFTDNTDASGDIPLMRAITAARLTEHD